MDFVLYYQIQLTFGDNVSMINETQVTPEQLLTDHIYELNGLLFTKNMPDRLDMAVEREGLEDILSTVISRPLQDVQTQINAIKSFISNAEARIKAQYNASIDAYLKHCIPDEFKLKSDSLVSRVNDNPTSSLIKLELIAEVNILLQQIERFRREKNAIEVRLEDLVVHPNNHALTEKRNHHISRLVINDSLKKAREQIISDLNEKPGFPVMLKLINKYQKNHQQIENYRSEIKTAYLQEVRNFIDIPFKIIKLRHSCKIFCDVYSQNDFATINEETDKLIKENRLSEKSFQEYDDSINTIHQAIMKYKDIVKEWEKKKKKASLAFIPPVSTRSLHEESFFYPKLNRLPALIDDKKNISNTSTPSAQENHSSNIFHGGLLILGGVVLIAASLALCVTSQGVLSPLGFCGISLGVACMVGGMYTIYDALILTENKPDSAISSTLYS